MKLVFAGGPHGRLAEYQRLGQLPDSGLAFGAARRAIGDRPHRGCDRPGDVGHGFDLFVGPVVHATNFTTRRAA